VHKIKEREASIISDPSTHTRFWRRISYRWFSY